MTEAELADYFYAHRDDLARCRNDWTHDFGAVLCRRSRPGASGR
jgi:hypothetical protein